MELIHRMQTGITKGRCHFRNIAIEHNEGPPDLHPPKHGTTFTITFPYH